MGSTASKPRRADTSASRQAISTVDEAALLAGLIQSPSSYAPTVNLERAIARRNVVLQTMVRTGGDRSGARPSGRDRPVSI